MKRMKHFLSYLIAVMCITAVGLNDVQAQSPVERIVAEAGPVEVSLSVEESRVATSEFDEYVSDYIVFQVDESAHRQVRDEEPTTMLLNVPTPKGNFTLRLVEHKITSPDFRVESSSGNHYFDTPFGTHYRGIVEGHEGSVAGASFFEGEISIMASTREHGNLSVNKIQTNGDDRMVAYFQRDLLQSDEFICNTEEPNEIPEFLMDARMRDEILSQRQGEDNCVRVHFEVDEELHNNKGGVAEAATYVEGIFSQVVIIYENENIDVAISYIHVWDTPDPFEIAPCGSGGSSGQAINQFQQYFLQGADLNGDLGHLVALDAGGCGGVARGIGVLCLNQDSRLAYSDVGTNWQAFPQYTFTVMVVAHEMGHNLGSPHTHGCYWNGNATQIDDCGNIGQSSPEGGACYDRFDEIEPAEGGTIMSYCHLNAVGINFNLGFGEQPGDLVRVFTYGAPCLTPCPDLGCAPVYQVQLTTVTETTASLEWIHNDADSYDVTYGYEGNFTTVTVTDPSIDLTGLDPATKYDVTITPSCTAGEGESVFQDFSTLCNTVYGVPFVELFENENWQERSYELDPCWSSNNSDEGYGWAAEKGETPSGNTGPSGDHTSGIGKYAYAEASFGSDNDLAELLSPSVDLTGANGPFVSFWYHMFGATVDGLTIEVSNDGGSVWNPLGLIEPRAPTIPNPNPDEPIFETLDDPWRQFVADLSAYENSTIKLRFTAKRGADFQGDIAIDDLIITDSSLVDVSVTEIVSPINGCGLSNAEVVSVVIENSGYETLTAGTEIDMILELDDATISTQTLTLAADLEPGASLPFDFASTLDLTNDGQYTVSVRANLTTDEIDGNNTRGTEVVSKLIINGYPYTQSFENGSDWVSGGAESSWALGTPAKQLIFGASDGDNAWVTGGLGPDSHNALEESWVEGPCFDFSNMESADITFDVWWEIETIWEGATFQYSTDNGNTWATLGSRGDGWFNCDTITTMPGLDGWSGTDDGDDRFEGSEGWVTVTHPLDVVIGEPTVFFRMLFISDPAVQFDGIAFDNIRIEGVSLVPPCYEETVNQTTCNPAEVGTTVTTYTAEADCDSVVTEITTLLPSYDITLTDYSCNPLDTGTVVNTFVAASTCDSIVREVTLLAPSYNYVIDVTTCDPEEVGVADFTGTTTLGCDSLVQVSTTLQDAYEVELIYNSCDITGSGTVVTTLEASDGCDSIVTEITNYTPIDAGFTYVEDGGVVTFSNTSTNATSYTWSFGDGNVNTVENPSNTYSSNNDYTVELIASSDGCESDTFEVVITIVINSIDLISFIEDINIYPNPSNGNFAVEVRGNGGAEILEMTLFDVSGSALDKRLVNYDRNATATYQMNDLAQGMYFLRIRSGDQQTTLKVSILR